MLPSERYFIGRYDLRADKDGKTRLPDHILTVLQRRHPGREPKNVVLYGVQSPDIKPGVAITDYKPKKRGYHVLRIDSNGKFVVPEQLRSAGPLVCMGIRDEFEVVPQKAYEDWEKKHAKELQKLLETLDI